MNSSKTVELTANDSLTRLITHNLLANGKSVAEIARMAVVARATVYNWMNGAEASDRLLSRLITAAGLTHHPFKDILPQSILISGDSYDRDSLLLAARLEFLEEKYDAARKLAPDKLKGTGTSDKSLFKSKVLKKYSREIFNAAFNQRQTIRPTGQDRLSGRGAPLHRAFQFEY